MWHTTNNALNVRQYPNLYTIPTTPTTRLKHKVSANMLPRDPSIEKHHCRNHNSCNHVRSDNTLLKLSPASLARLTVNGVNLSQAARINLRDADGDMETRQLCQTQGLTGRLR